MAAPSCSWENGIASRCAVGRGIVVKSACVSTRKSTSASAPYLSRTRSLTTGNGQSILSTVLAWSRSLAFMVQSEQDFADRVVPARGDGKAGTGAFVGSQEDVPQIGRVLVAFPNG